MAWLTQESDPLDRVLVAGETFTIDRPGAVLINALAHDAVLACSEPGRCSITRIAPYRGKSTPSLAAEIAHVTACTDARALHALPAGMRREVVELEARRMRSQVVWLVAQHAWRALSAFAAGVAVAAGELRARARCARARCALARGK